MGYNIRTYMLFNRAFSRNNNYEEQKMTKEEAITRLHWLKRELIKGTDMNEPIDMAIEALHREEAEEKKYCHRIRPRNVEVVVRCKDCRHNVHCHETVAHTRLHDGFKEHWSEPIEWCSRGERREP